MCSRLVSLSTGLAALLLLTLCMQAGHCQVDSIAWSENEQVFLLLAQGKPSAWKLCTAWTLLMPCQLPPPAKVRDSQMF